MREKANAIIYITISIVLLSICLLIISCIPNTTETTEEEREKEDDINSSTVELKVAVGEEEKGLEVYTPSEVVSFEYKATPYFEESESYITLFGGIVGSTNGKWHSVRFQDKDGNDATVGLLRASMGYFHAGRWEIELRAKNAKGSVVYYGTTGTVYINPARVNAFSVALHGIQSIGKNATLTLTFTGLETEENSGMIPYLRLKYLNGEIVEKNGISDGWTLKKIGNGRIEYALKLSHLSAGEVDAYVALKLKNGSVNTAEAFKTILIDGELTKVTGTLESAPYVTPSFDIKEDRSELDGTITTKDATLIENANGKNAYKIQWSKDKTVSFTFQPTGETASRNVTVKWYMDAVYKGEGTSFSLALKDLSTTGGNYTISALISSDGEKTVSKEVILIVLPTEV